MFFKVLTNLKHNGDVYAPESIIEGEYEAFELLVKDGVLFPAKTVEEAMNTPIKEEVKQTENTWGAKPIEETEQKKSSEKKSELPELPEVEKQSPDMTGDNL